jgi:hypothetical protein
LSIETNKPPRGGRLEHKEGSNTYDCTTDICANA